ncbi:MAG: hypothetical protein WC635_07825 [Bacteriovorax sp.]|jgi:peptidoglycan/LPS O-acetylase OafA/YrhL
MLTNAKIDLKKYALYSLVLLLLAYLSAKTAEEFLVIVIVFVAACINHWMLVYATRRMSESAAGVSQKGRLLVPIMIIGKLVLVVAALSFGVQIMGKRILIPVLIYVLQIVVLYLSFERQTSAEKGS